MMRVIEIIRGSTHDGPGMRTTIFLKGCPLRCTWCQNPEGLEREREVWWEARKCIACGECRDACPSGALAADSQGVRLDRGTCTRCGACVDACPARALTFTSRDWTVPELLREALKDQEYYKAFGGGVTVSGGEPLVQAHEVAEFLARLRAAGVHTALDTCGLAAGTALDAVLPHVDHVLFDLKLMDAELHRTHTGQTNTVILENLQRIAAHVRDRAGRVRLWIRTPLVPGTTAEPQKIRAIGGFIREQLLDVVERWELCAFNSACGSKYERLGLPWPHAATPLMDQTELDALRATAIASGIPADTVTVSGLVAAKKR